MASGAAWMLGAQIFDRALGLVSIVILARLLIPEDFGIVAMATSVVALLELLTGFGFDTALVSDKEAPPERYHTAWTLNLGVTTGAAVTVLLLAYPAAIFYAEPALAMVVACLGAALFLQGFQNIGVVAFRKEMRFQQEFWFLLGPRLCAFGTTVALAVMTRSYWSLVGGIIAGRLARVVLSFAMHPFRPYPSLKDWRQLLGFSQWLLLNNLLNFLNTRSTDFIIGRAVGPTGLGTYNLGYEFATLPTTHIVAPVNRAVLPGYAQMSSERDKLRTGYLDVMAAIAIFAMPAAFGIAATSELVVQVLLGPKWLDAIPIVQVLAFYGMWTAMDSNSYVAYLTLGRPSIATALAAGRLLVLLPSMLIATRYFGIEGTAWAMLSIATLITPIGFVVLARLLDLSFTNLWHVVWRPLMSGLLMFFAIREAQEWFVSSAILGSSAALLIVTILLGVIYYALFLFTFWIISGRTGPVENALLNWICGLIGAVARSVNWSAKRP